MKREINNKQFNIIDTNKANFDLKKINFLKKYNNPIIVEQKQNLKIIEFLDENNLNDQLNREFILKEGSSLEYLRLSNIPEQNTLESNFHMDLQENSKINIHLFELGSGESTNKLEANLDKNNTDIFINTLIKLNNNSKVFNSFNITHKHPNTFSDIRAKHLLDDNSKADFEAKALIQNGANYSKAFQDCKTILLSDNAIIKARPHLEILTDELEASHGAVTGELDKKAIYYLRSRGISEIEAKNILIEAFYLELIENIQDTNIKSWIKDMIQK